ncbi:hypothetical protein HNQ07_003586 [Deinococcus metalli]|uniref:Uncharacterized protein n=1 Tax=Deinococcus metalli TaxID=1141878 RepID=A0A7W8KH92_9DEIO|nr:hypothetical protein [Deinococcus metalli]MBB5378085.1 hypothetical protein [Deinococcus metalli]GHF54307.1 hypothetical protein GCM10017781_33270 [Deinococcus metalli]
MTKSSHDRIKAAPDLDGQDVAPELEPLGAPLNREEDQPSGALEPTYTRRIEVRLAMPAPQVRYEKGKPVRDPAPDMDRIIAAIRPVLERQIVDHHGSHTELLITASRVPGIRVNGNFGEKASAVQSRVQGWVDQAFEGLSDLDG